MAVDVINAVASSFDFGVTSQDVVFGATPSNDELLLLVHHTTTDAITVTSTGFTQVGSVMAGQGNVPRCTILRRTAASEGDATYTVDYSGAVNNSAVVGLRITGQDVASPIDVNPTHTAAFGSIVCPSIVTLTDGAMHLCLGPAADTVTDATPAGYTQEFPGSSVRCGVYSKIIVTAGATGTQNIGSDNEHAAISLAIKPAGAADAFVRPQLVVPRVALHRASRW